MALPIKELENATPKAKKYKMLDGGGLSLLILPTGTKLWLWRYQFNGGEKNMTFGEYPVAGPKEARELHFAEKSYWRQASIRWPNARRRPKRSTKKLREFSARLRTAFRKWPASGGMVVDW